MTPHDDKLIFVIFGDELQILLSRFSNSLFSRRASPLQLKSLRDGSSNFIVENSGVYQNLLHLFKSNSIKDCIYIVGADSSNCPTKLKSQRANVAVSTKGNNANVPRENCMLS